MRDCQVADTLRRAIRQALPQLQGHFPVTQQRPVGERLLHTPAPKHNGTKAACLMERIGQIADILSTAGNIVTITIMPAFIFEHIIKR